MGVYFVFIALVVIVAIGSGGTFLRIQNITNVLRQTVWVGIMTFGACFVFSLGGIDLSVGSTYGAVGLAVSFLILGGMPPVIAIIIGIALGAVIGLLNGFLVYKVNIVPFIATMAVMTVTRGLMEVATKGVPISGVNQFTMRLLGQGYLFGIPIPVIIAVIVFLVLYYVLNNTRFGRYCLSIGSNEEAARLVGINVSKYGILAYMLTGITCAIAGVLVTGRLEGAMPTAGEGYELDVIAAAVIGGTSLNGGKASMPGCLLGALLMAVVRNGMNLMHIDTYWHDVVMGIIIVVAVIVDELGTKYSKKISEAKLA
ncbi:MAG: ABC transporter permease [Eubacterium sp.]|nr:ABC transporter permease [Eubacterium sp.]